MGIPQAELSDRRVCRRSSSMSIPTPSTCMYTLPANTNPVLIGPSAVANFLTNGQPRPVRIEAAMLLLQNVAAPSDPGLVDLPIKHQRSPVVGRVQRIKNIQTNVPTDLYYDPTSPDGSAYFWPVCNISRARVRLEIWQMIAQFVSIQDPIGGPGGPSTLPPAYRAALMLTLAEMLLRRDRIAKANPALIKSALEARAAVFGNNAKSPRIVTQDAGMSRAKPSGQKQDFKLGVWERSSGGSARSEVSRRFHFHPRHRR